MITYNTKNVKEWFERASVEKDPIVKFILFYISLEVGVKLNDNKIRDLKINQRIKQLFFSKIEPNHLVLLEQKLNDAPLINMKPGGDQRWNGKLNSVNDFKSIIEFIIRARNNLFHGDKGLHNNRDEFIITQGIEILEPLVECVLVFNEPSI